ncbi:unnamed protein product [Eruca vesicaria subsp. sativa]|uniref:Uncharacterized protein n=1 Tax=Eruca vesicaria subsp. sativa TaxID=29727 RepID=A0ABC8LKJ6_ERUVS|nr:unnamed protein product [Eruca vesicaria subsp. sativa]
MGLKHLQISAHANSPKGIYLYAILLFVTCEHRAGRRYTDLLDWKNDLTKLNRCWNQVKRSLRDVPIWKSKEYGTNMILFMPPRSCELKSLGRPCRNCNSFCSNPQVHAIH